MSEKPNWTVPTEVSALDIAFPGSVEHLMPAYDEIPKEFKDSNNPWCEFQRDWFFKGLKQEQIPEPKEGITGHIALRHLQAIQHSFQPKHEHKEAAVAYLASLWFQPKVRA